jgi:putative oxidoreductase
MENTPLQKVSFLVLRVLGSLIFIAAGLNHLLQTAGATARLKKAELGYLATWIAPADTLIILSGIGLLLGGFMLLAGFKTRLAALALLAILIPITLTVQVANAAGSGPLFKNIALIGVLLFFIVNGAVHYGLDQVLIFKRKNKTT